MFILINQIKVKFNILTFAFLAAYISIILSFTLKYDQGFLIAFLLFIVTGLIYSMKTNAFKSNFITRYFVGSFTYFYLKLKAFYEYLSESSAKDSLNGLKFKATDLGITFILFFIFGVPLILIVVGLLASVNPNFANFISWEVVGKLFFTTFVFVYLASELYLLKAIPKETKLLKSPKVSFTLDNAKILLRVALMVLIILNIFYIFFIGADLMGEINNTKQHFINTSYRSYSEYSVSRFWALIQVSIINLFLIYIITKPFKVLNHANSKLLKPLVKLNIIILGIMSFALIISTLARLNLYISGYGFTSDRLYGLTFTLLLIVFLGLFIWGVFRKKHSKLHSIAFGILIIYFALMHLIPMNYFTARINHELYQAGAIKVYDINDYISVTRTSSENSITTTKCSNADYNTGEPYGTYNAYESEDYLASLHILKDPNNKLSEFERNCLKEHLNEVRESINSNSASSKSWNFIEAITKNALYENKEFLESK